jgi:hypothetical protein
LVLKNLDRKIPGPEKFWVGKFQVLANFEKFRSWQMKIEKIRL